MFARLTPPRPTFGQDMTADAREVMQAHVDYWLPHIGAGLVIARLGHPCGISAKVMHTPARGIGAGGTFLVILAAAITLLWQAVR